MTLARRMQEGQAQVTLSVTDTGVGIALEDQARLFSAFTQVGQGAGRPTVEGTGLGLYLCSKLAELLEGSIKVQSELGKGSTFTLVLREETST